MASEADFGLICEDDLSFDGTMQEVLAAGIRSADDWNILRLSGLSNGRTMRVKELCGGHALCVNMGRMKGAGAYVVDRMAARVFTQKLLPMWLPYDHAFDREWRFGLTGASECSPSQFPRQAGVFVPEFSGIRAGNCPSIGDCWARTHIKSAMNCLGGWRVSRIGLSSGQSTARGSSQIEICRKRESQRSRKSSQFCDRDRFIYRKSA